MLSTLLFNLGVAKFADQVNVVKHYSEIKDAQNRYNAVINNAGLQDMSVRDVVSELYLTNKIDTTKYKSALKTVNEIEKATGKTFWLDDKEWSLWSIVCIS